MLRSLFFHPPIVVARLGGSRVPLDCFEWVAADSPRSGGETAIRPAWTLDVQSDGSIRPRMPTEIVFRDGQRLRPTAPFLELWAYVDGADSPRPLDLDLLAAEGLSLADIHFIVNARNRKAARRTRRDDLEFGTFPPLKVAGNDHALHVLVATSPPEIERPMIPKGRSIPIGSVQILRPTRMLGTTTWSGAVDLTRLRLRFTPAAGEFYGPPRAAAAGAVALSNAFLDPDAGWYGASRGDAVIPPDSIDEENSVSLGVVDDTCDIRISATLQIGTATLTCAATVLSAPPDFSPDRRPFLSLSDELLDRERRHGDGSIPDDEWVEDFFERAYETASLLNVDRYRNERAVLLRSAERSQQALDQDGLADERAMGHRDGLRNMDHRIGQVSEDVPLPLSKRTKEAHRAISDIASLKRFVVEHPGRLRALIREPFVADGREGTGGSTMQMPPFMRHSTAGRLTVLPWQYDLLMAWVADVESRPENSAGVTDEVADTVEKAAWQEEAKARRAEVLADLPDWLIGS